MPSATVGRYRLIRRIARGGMGDVHLADLPLMPGVRKLAAVKVLRFCDGPAEQRALMHEARLASHLSHPNVVQMLDVGVQDGEPWLAMEFVGGVSLHELVREAETRRMPLPPWVMARMIADSCAGLHAVHEAKDEEGRPLEAVHRDVSPQNLLLSWDGIIKVADFGVARSSLQYTVTRTGTIKGKLAFMAPEQARSGAVDRRADIFALGVILWEGLAGKPLFRGHSEEQTLARVLLCQVPPLASVAAEAPPALASIAERALRAEPSARFATAEEMRHALESAMRAARVDVGTAEVARLMAAVLPDRVREHEEWLRQADREREADLEEAKTTVHEKTPLPTAAAPAPRPAVETTARLQPSRWRTLGPVAAVVGGGILALVLGSRTGTPSAGSVPPLAAPTPPAVPAPTPIAAVVPPVEPPRERPVARAPAKKFGLLTVGSQPVWSRIRVDGATIGDTPVVDHRLAAGPHTVEALVAGKGPPLRQRVKVKPDKTTRVMFEGYRR